MGVKLPAVVHTAESTLFVAAEEQRRTAMGTGVREQADVTGGVAEGDKVLPEESYPQWRAIGFDFVTEHGR